MEKVQIGGNLYYDKKPANNAGNYAPAKDIPNDAYSFNTKYKPKKNKKTAGVLTTIALMAVSAFAAYKGRGKIQQVSSDISKTGGEKARKIFNDFTSKFPNLGEAVRSLGRACKTPIKAISELFHKTQK